MKLIEKSISLRLLVLAASTAMLMSCATTGIRKAEKTTATMQDVQSSINETVAQIDSTNAALDAVINAKDSPDLTNAFETYSENVAKMENTGQALIRHSNEMSARGNDYFQEWRKSGDTYTNPEIQRLSQERRTELMNTFAQISESSLGVKGSLNSYISEIKQIRTYLSNDLTAKGIEAIAPISEKAMDDGNSVKSAIQPMLMATERALSEMSTGAAAGGRPNSNQY